MLRLKKSDPKINIDGYLGHDEPMARHTTFKVGGPADIFVIPRRLEDLYAILEWCHHQSVPYFILGGGANILVADAGIRGVVIDMSGFNEISTNDDDADQTLLVAGAGLPISDASAWAANHGFAGLEFIYSMPGSVAGAVWMNARCYGAEIADILSFVDLVEPVETDSNRQSYGTRRYLPQSEDFAYKQSPFQEKTSIMVRAGFRLGSGDSHNLWTIMKEHEADRTRKGHFIGPCAGSVFKNNRDFGKPTGQLLDGLGMRGRSVGGARVSDLHANIIINDGEASAADILSLAKLMAAEASDKLGIHLEREVLLIGDWEERNG